MAKTHSSTPRMTRRNKQIDIICTRLARGMVNKRGEPINSGGRLMTLFTERIFPTNEPEDFSNESVSMALEEILKVFLKNVKNTEGWSPDDLQIILDQNPRKTRGAKP